MFARTSTFVFIGVCLGAFFWVSCVPQELTDDDFAAALPKLEDLEVRIGQSDTGGGEVAQALLDPFAECEECCIEGEGDDASYIDGELYLMTRNAKWHVNGGLILTIGWIGAIVQSPANEAIENGYIWGPWNDNLGRADYRFVMEREDDKQYVFRLQGRNINDPGDTWTSVVSGNVTSTGEPHRGFGRLLLDHDAIHALDSAHPSFAQGTIEYNFDVREFPYIVDVIFTDVAVDEREFLNAAYQYRRFADRAGYLRFQAAGDFVPEDVIDGVIETLEVETQWTAQGEGYGTAVAEGGSLAGENIVAYVMTECWADSAGLYYQTYAQNSVTFNDDSTVLQERLCGAESHCPTF